MRCGMLLSRPAAARAPAHLRPGSSPALPAAPLATPARCRCHHRCQRTRLHASGKGFGHASGQAGGGKEAQDAIKRARDTQLSASELMAELMQAPDPRAAATARVESLNEAFFAAASAYVALARRDGEPAVAAKLEEMYHLAVSVKEATLRPEIRLLNRLLNAPSKGERDTLFAQNAAALVSDNRYFFSLVARMTRDVEASPAGPMNPKRSATLATLQAIAAEAQQRAPA